MGNPLYPEDDDPLAIAVAPDPPPARVLNSQSTQRILNGGYGEAKQRLVLHAILGHLLLKIPDQRIEIDMLEVAAELQKAGTALLTRVHPVTGHLVIGMGDPARAGR